MEGGAIAFLTSLAWIVVLMALGDTAELAADSIIQGLEASGGSFSANVYVTQLLLVWPGLVVILLSLMAATFYKGDVDPRLAIRRTTVYGALGILFVFFFSALGNVVSEFVESRLGLPGIVGTGLYGGSVAVLLLPLRGRFMKVAEGWVPSLDAE